MKLVISAHIIKLQNFLFIILWLDGVFGRLSHTRCNRAVAGGYSIDPPDMTKRNLASFYHMKNALDETGAAIKIDYPKALVSMGELRPIEVTAASITAENALALSWVDNSNQGLADPDDLLLVVLYAPVTHQYYFSQEAATRQDDEVLLPLPNGFTNTEVHCWAGFRNVESGVTADSRYVILG